MFGHFFVEIDRKILYNVSKYEFYGDIVMKTSLSLGVVVLFCALLFEHAGFAQENANVGSTEEELNEAQILEKKMLENRKPKKTKRVRSSIYRHQGAKTETKTETNVRNSVNSSAKGLPHSSMPSLSKNMFVK